MCMIVYRPVGKHGRGANIAGSTIDTALRRHPDGFGVAYREDGDLRVEKFGPAEAKRFRKALKRVDRAGVEYVAHFRFATHGAKDAAHAHPYEYVHPEDGRVLVFHNGVIDIRTTGPESDTEVFVRDVLAQLPSRWWESPALRFLVTETIGWSKLTVMTREGTYNLHESRGTWDAGIWYSSPHKASTYTPRDGKWTGSSTTWGKSATTGTQSAITPYAGNVPATRPATERDAKAAVLGAKPSATVISHGQTSFRHGGHSVSSFADIDRMRDGDYPDGVMCDICYTMGDLYVIDGGVFIDMAHKGDDPNEEEVLDA